MVQPVLSGAGLFTEGDIDLIFIACFKCEALFMGDCQSYFQSRNES